MAFTGVLGSTSSKLGSVVLGDGASSPPLPGTSLDQVDVFGGPIWYAPWQLRTEAPQPYVQAPAPPIPPTLQFTGIWGNPNAAWGHFEFGVVIGAPEVTPTAPPPPVIFTSPLPFGPFGVRTYAAPPHNAAPPVSHGILIAPPVSGGPVRGAPWTHFITVQPPRQEVATLPPPPINPTPPPVQGGPIRGAPYYRQEITDQPGRVAPVPPPPPYLPPNVEGGPIPFVPWHQRGNVQQFTPIPPPPVVPAGVSNPVPTVSGGPIMFAPWMGGRLESTQPTPGPTPPAPPTPVFSGTTPPLARVPSDDRRIARFTEVTADIVNSLVRQGQLMRSQATADSSPQWTIQVTVLTFDGRTGAVVFLPSDFQQAYPALPANVFMASPGPAFRGINAADLPTSGVVAGGYGPIWTATVDQFGRVVSAASTTTGIEVDSSFGVLTTDVDGSTITFNLSLSNKHTVTLGASGRTLAVSGGYVGQIFTIRLVQGSGGSMTVNWFSTIKWPGGTAPTLTTTTGKTDTFVFLCTSAGNYDGYIAGQNL